ncbi:FliA/WhiG family RNA polymerase sigma factor [Desulfoplanes sp.]
MNKPWAVLEEQRIPFADLDPGTQKEIVSVYGLKIKIQALRLKAKLPTHIDPEELMSAGSLGLMEALYKYDPDSNTHFETYADTRIKGAMLDELRKMDWLSRGMRQKIKKIEAAMQGQERRYGTIPSNTKIAALTGFTKDEVEQCREALENQFCLNIDALEETTRFATLKDPFEHPYEKTATNEIIDKLAHLIEQLSKREILVLSLYYAEELNMREAAEVLGVTEGRISQLHSQAITKLRKKFIADHGRMATDP